jgi:hypothetical protein
MVSTRSSIIIKVLSKCFVKSIKRRNFYRMPCCSKSEIVFLGGYDFTKDIHLAVVEKLDIDTG